MINIAKRGTSGATDGHYRYKRNRIETRFDARQKHTHINNIHLISTQLKVDAESLARALTKRARKQLSCNVVCRVNKDQQILCFYFTGSHASELIDDILQDLIEKYMICPECALPEYDGKTGYCTACGFSNSERVRPDEAAAVEQVDTIQQWEIDISAQMNMLYNKRDVAKERGTDHVVFDTLLDAAWQVENRSAFVAWQDYVQQLTAERRTQ